MDRKNVLSQVMHPKLQMAENYMYINMQKSCIPVQSNPKNMYPNDLHNVSQHIE